MCATDNSYQVDLSSKVVVGDLINNCGLTVICFLLSVARKIAELTVHYSYSRKQVFQPFFQLRYLARPAVIAFH